jgi:hypothetical protein
MHESIALIISFSLLAAAADSFVVCLFVVVVGPLRLVLEKKIYRRLNLIMRQNNREKLKALSAHSTTIYPNFIHSTAAAAPAANFVALFPFIVRVAAAASKQAATTVK